MYRLHSLAPRERLVLRSLFENAVIRRAQIFSVIEGAQGTALVDSVTDPHVARLDYRIYSVFGGDPEHPLARLLVESLPARRLLPISDRWLGLVKGVHGGGRLHSYEEYHLSEENLELGHVQRLQGKVPEGIRMMRVDIPLAKQIDDGDEVEDFKLAPTFLSPEDFVARGIGFCALSGERVVCVAHSDAVTREGIEVQIETVPAFRRKGIATAVSATLISYCLQNGLVPYWNAENKESVGLAEKLGYTNCKAYKMTSFF